LSVELSFNELIASWWEGTLQRDHVVLGLRWYWWALAGKTLAGFCLILAALDLVGRDRLSKFSNWLGVQAEASTLRRIFNHWRIARSVKLYYDNHFARLPTEDALERMDADVQYMALTESMEDNFDQIDWKRLIPWAVCLVLVFVLSYYLENSLLLLGGVIAVNIPTTWSYIGSVLLKPLIPITLVLRQRLIYRVIYWLGAATWLLEVADLGRGLSA
jgi:hypothetical protein